MSSGSSIEEESLSVPRKAPEEKPIFVPNKQASEEESDYSDDFESEEITSKKTLSSRPTVKRPREQMNVPRKAVNLPRIPPKMPQEPSPEELRDSPAKASIYLKKLEQENASLRQSLKQLNSDLGMVLDRTQIRKKKKANPEVVNHDMLRNIQRLALIEEYEHSKVYETYSRIEPETFTNLKKQVDDLQEKLKQEEKLNQRLNNKMRPKKGKVYAHDDYEPNEFVELSNQRTYLLNKLKKLKQLSERTSEMTKHQEEEEQELRDKYKKLMDIAMHYNTPLRNFNRKNRKQDILLLEYNAKSRSLDVKEKSSLSKVKNLEVKEKKLAREVAKYKEEGSKIVETLTERQDQLEKIANELAGIKQAIAGTGLESLGAYVNIKVTNEVFRFDTHSKLKIDDFSNAQFKKAENIQKISRKLQKKVNNKQGRSPVKDRSLVDLQKDKRERPREISEQPKSRSNNLKAKKTQLKVNKTPEKRHESPQPAISDKDRLNAISKSSPEIDRSQAKSKAGHEIDTLLNINLNVNSQAKKEELEAGTKFTKPNFKAALGSQNKPQLDFKVPDTQRQQPVLKELNEDKKEETPADPVKSFLDELKSSNPQGNIEKSTRRRDRSHLLSNQSSSPEQEQPRNTNPSKPPNLSDVLGKKNQSLAEEKKGDPLSDLLGDKRTGVYENKQAGFVDEKRNDPLADLLGEKKPSYFEEKKPSIFEEKKPSFFEEKKPSFFEEKKPSFFDEKKNDPLADILGDKKTGLFEEKKSSFTEEKKNDPLADILGEKKNGLFEEKKSDPLADLLGPSKEPDFSKKSTLFEEKQSDPFADLFASNKPSPQSGQVENALNNNKPQGNPRRRPEPFSNQYAQENPERTADISKKSDPLSDLFAAKNSDPLAEIIGLNKPNAQDPLASIIGLNKPTSDLDSIIGLSKPQDSFLQQSKPKNSDPLADLLGNNKAQSQARPPMESFTNAFADLDEENFL